MKTLLTVLLVLAVLGLSASAFAGVVTHTNSNLQLGWNLIALPGVPLDPDPEAVFGAITIDYRLMRFDPVIGSMIMYDEFEPEVFGGMLLTDGYWLDMIAPGTLSYQGLDDTNTMDIWVSLPKAGWTLIGNPFSYAFNWANIDVTDGNTTVSLQNAAYTHNWVVSLGLYYEAASGSMRDVGLEDDFPYSEHLPVWHGVWVQSKVDKLALILNAAP